MESLDHLTAALCNLKAVTPALPQHLIITLPSSEWYSAYKHIRRSLNGVNFYNPTGNNGFTVTRSTFSFLWMGVKITYAIEGNISVIDEEQERLNQATANAWVRGSETVPPIYFEQPRRPWPEPGQDVFSVPVPGPSAVTSPKPKDSHYSPAPGLGLWKGRKKPEIVKKGEKPETDIVEAQLKNPTLANKTNNKYE